MTISTSLATDPDRVQLAASYFAGTWTASDNATASYRLPTLDSCELVAALADRVPGVSDPNPGGLVTRHGLVLAPGSVRIRSVQRGAEDDDPGWALDWTDHVEGFTHGRTRDSRHRMTRASLGSSGTGKRAVVAEWSRKSRLNMVRVIAEHDWAAHIEAAPPGWRPQMLTLTLPGDWLAVAPDARAFKALFARWQKRFAREFGRRWAGTWKLEFQGRGAPHLHLYGNAPTGLVFKRWLSWSWSCAVFSIRAERPWASDWTGYVETMRASYGEPVANHLVAGTGVDWREGVRGTDPRSIAFYFLGKSVAHNIGAGKEYQHRVPDEWQDGPGRFWGVMGLERIAVVRELDGPMFVQLRRLVRRWSASRGYPIRAAGWSRWQGYTLLHADAPGWLGQALRWDGLGAGDPPAHRRLGTGRGVNLDTGERIEAPPLAGPRDGAILP